MAVTEVQVKFDAPASLRKWPSVRNERISDTQHPSRIFWSMALLTSALENSWRSQHPNTAFTKFTQRPNPTLITAVLSAEIIIELARLRDYLA